jgi:hypothetical protein
MIAALKRACFNLIEKEKNMLDINKLIADLKKAAGDSVTITVNVVSSEAAAPEMPYTDFNVGDRVMVCHIKKDGTGTKHTWGTVTEVLQKDNKGWYTRVAGDNDCHYKTGLKYDEERLGSKIISLD